MTARTGPAPSWTPRSPLYRLGARSRLLDVVTEAGMFGAMRAARRRAIASLGLRPGQRVLDLACGTGPNLPGLAAAVGPEGEVLAVDASPALAAAARRRIGRAGVADTVRLVTATWPIEDPAIYLDTSVDAAICCLGFTVIDRWEDGLDAFVGCVRPGGRVTVVDWLVGPDRSPALDAYIRLGSWLAQADPARPLAAALARRLPGVERRRLRCGLELVTGVR